MRAFLKKLRLKIFNNEYIDFGVLISNHLAGEDKYEISIVNGRSGQPSLFFEWSISSRVLRRMKACVDEFRPKLF